MTNEIQKEDMFSLLLEADPSFQPNWRAFQDEWEGEKCGLPLTIAIDAFARHLIERLEASDTSRFKDIFAVIERLHFSTDSYVNNEIKGITEGILDTGSYTRLHPYDFEPWLEPETRRAWLALNTGYYGRNWPADR